MSSSVVSSRAAITAFTLGALFFGYAFIQRVAPSIMTAELMRDFAVGGAALGSLSAFYFWTYAGIQLPVGMLTDQFGPRKLMSVAAIICALAAVGFAVSESLIVASFWRAIIGGTVAFAFVGTLAIIGYWFEPAKHAMMAGVLQGVGMFGAVFAQSLFRPLVELFGWRVTMGGLAVAAFIISILVFIFVPKRTTQQRKTDTSISILDGLKIVVSNSQSWLCAMIGFGMASVMLSFSGLWAVPWLNNIHGYTIVEAAQTTSFLFLGWAVFSPIVGWGSDYMGRRNTLVTIGSILYLLGFASIIFYTPESRLGLTALMFFTGASGSTMTISFIASKEHNRAESASTAVGLMNMFVVGSGAVMQPTIGWLLDLNWDGTLVEGARVYSSDAYTLAFSSLLVVIALAILGSIMLRETYCKPVQFSNT